MTASTAFTLRDFAALEPIVAAAQSTGRVRRLLDNGSVMSGTARSLGDENGNFARDGEDIRDLFLRITADSGFEYFLPVGGLMEQVLRGEFVHDIEVSR